MTGSQGVVLQYDLEEKNNWRETTRHYMENIFILTSKFQLKKTEIAFVFSQKIVHTCHFSK